MWGCIAVEFRTHWMNHQSRAAIARLGAKQDGVLRSHSRMLAGTLLDTVVFSIIPAEWPTVRRHLQHRLSLAPSGSRADGYCLERPVMPSVQPSNGSAGADS